ncbi:MAG: hypothetical protein H7269_04890 [Cellulomonas sp.]|nr:hypothetical protein [Cellulomonas sp.]
MPEPAHEASPRASSPTVRRDQDGPRTRTQHLEPEGRVVEHADSSFDARDPERLADALPLVQDGPHVDAAPLGRVHRMQVDLALVSGGDAPPVTHEIDRPLAEPRLAGHVDGPPLRAVPGLDRMAAAARG